MSPELAAALERQAGDPRLRRWLRRERLCSGSANDCLEVSTALHRQGDYRAAALWMLRACRLVAAEGTNDSWRYRLANALRCAGRNRLARMILEDLVQRYPQWAEPARSLAWLHRRARRTGEAGATLERLAQAAGYDPRIVLGSSGFLQEMGLYPAAERLVSAALRSRPVAALYAERGTILASLGRFKEAEDTFSQALARDPNQAGVWLRLAMMRSWNDAATSPLGFFQAALERSDLKPDTRTTLYFALAKIEDDLGRFESAFYHAKQGNIRRAGEVRFDRKAWAAWEQSLYTALPIGFFDHRREVSVSSEAPVFIVGMPRSGTTLVERRLAGHPALEGVGELETVEAVGLSLAGAAGLPAGLVNVRREALTAAVHDWRARLPETVPEGARIVDKNPLNFLHLGLISLLFPRATIIRIRRSPLDTAVSLYLNHFAHARMSFSYRWDDIAWMYAMYQRLMAHWQRVVPIPIYELDYACLVAEPEAELRRLLDFLGLEWNPRCLEAVADQGVIATASLWQARQPVYTHAVGRARHYAPWLDPLREAFEREGVETG